jgi:hypothetical protein
MPLLLAYTTPTAPCATRAAERRLAQSIQLSFQCLEVGLVPRAVEDLERDDRRDRQLVFPHRGLPIRRDQRMLRSNPDRRVEQIGMPVVRRRHGTSRLPQASSLKWASISGLNPWSFVVRSINASISSRRRLPLIGGMPFVTGVARGADRALLVAAARGLAELAGFLAVATDPAGRGFGRAVSFVRFVVVATAFRVPLPAGSTDEDRDRRGWEGVPIGTRACNYER